VKILIPIAVALAGTFYWLNRHPGTVRPSDATEEAQSLEPEFAVDIHEESEKVQERVPIEIPEQPESEMNPSADKSEGAGSGSHGNQASPAKPGHKGPRSGEKNPNPANRPGEPKPPEPANNGPREEIVGGIKSVYGADGISLEASGPWVNGQKDGFWQEFNPKGQVIRAENYSNGQLDGLSESWFDDGSPRSSVPMKSGKIDGQASYWLANGQVDESRTGLYRDGSKVEE